MARLLGEKLALQQIFTWVLINSLLLATAQNPPQIAPQNNLSVPVQTIPSSQDEHSSQDPQGHRFLAGLGKALGEMPLIGSAINIGKDIARGGLDIVENVFDLNQELQKDLCFPELENKCVPEWNDKWLDIPHPFKIPYLKPELWLFSTPGQDPVRIQPQLNFKKYFDPSRPLKILIPGYLGRAGNEYKKLIENHIKTIAATYVKLQNALVIAVEYDGGTSYEQAVSNARVVGFKVGHFLKYLQDKAKYNLQNVHVIGEGVGAHAASYIKEWGIEIGRITGLDPTARGYQEVTSLVHRLDKDDASFVDVIHTDTYNGHTGVGIDAPAGHLDFYAHGGANQPGCDDSPNSFLNNLFENSDAANGGFCNHVRAMTYFMQSLESRDCRFVGRVCNNFNTYRQGLCDGCNNVGDCAEMGDGASKYNYDVSSQRQFYFRVYLPSFCNPKDSNYLQYLHLTGQATTTFAPPAAQTPPTSPSQQMNIKVDLFIDNKNSKVLYPIEGKVDVQIFTLDNTEIEGPGEQKSYEKSSSTDSFVIKTDKKEIKVARVLAKMKVTKNQDKDGYIRLKGIRLTFENGESTTYCPKKYGGSMPLQPVYFDNYMKDICVANQFGDLSVSETS